MLAARRLAQGAPRRVKVNLQPLAVPHVGNRYSRILPVIVWKNIVCRFGVPKRLVSDNGTQFTSHLLKKLCGDVGIQQVFASVEHPQTNG